MKGGGTISRVMLGAALVGLCGASSIAFQDSDQANIEIRRLPPSAFSELPAPIIRYLERRGCTVPQPGGDGIPSKSDDPLSNVVRAHLTSAHQTDWDWAVLCSTRGISTILIFRNGSTTQIGELAAEADVYDRGIGAVPSTVEGYRLRYKDVKDGDPPGFYPKGGFDHDGIEDGQGMGSALYYWSGKYWYHYPGAD